MNQKAFVAAILLIACFMREASSFQAGNVHRPLSAASRPSSIPIHAKKSSKGGKKSDKLQVRLLKDVPGQGQKGDILNIAPSFFQNKLQREKLAEIVTDDDVEKIKEKEAAAEKDRFLAATAMQERIDALATISIERKVGPSGKLFGKLSDKNVLEILKEQFPVGALEGKTVKIIAISSCSDDGQSCDLDMEKAMIESLGVYEAKVKLLNTPDIRASFRFEVKDEASG
mmetsp:Transcript_40109/g.59098  ORF Transcript_40109/g.59098 Transcript_40109/m.59098 type:complete len:228 (-) Transcript_40109:263-946(-)